MHVKQQHVYEEHVPILQPVVGADSVGIVNFDAREKKNRYMTTIEGGGKFLNLCQTYICIHRRANYGTL